MCVQLGARIGSKGIKFGFWKKNASDRVYLCVLIYHFSPVKCSETIFLLGGGGLHFLTPYKGVPTNPFKVCIL